jgi:hypothetical protein
MEQKSTPNGDIVAHQLRAARVHRESAARHEAAAMLWDARLESARAEFERRRAALERELAQLETDRLQLDTLRAGLRADADESRLAEVERVSVEIGERADRLRARDAELERVRARLSDPARDLRYQRRKARESDRARRAQAAMQRGVARGERADSPPPGVSAVPPHAPVSTGSLEQAVAAAHSAVSSMRDRARRLASVLSRGAEALDDTARLADAHAERRERMGRIEEAAAERLVAAQAREAAERARAQAADWLALGWTGEETGADEPR